MRIDDLHLCWVETITWCKLTPDGPPATRFRSPELKPGGTVEPAIYSSSLVQSICQHRSALLKKRKAPVVHNFGGDGRFLLFFPGRSLFDGAAEFSSNGYFNSENEPPWDTWVFFGEASPSPQSEDYRFYLLSWVPEDYLSIAQSGVEVNPEACLEWLDESVHVDSAKLRRDLKGLKA